VKQMMTVVGEEGTSIEDFTTMLKAELVDNCYLQQNAYDDVDGATPRERQVLVFDKLVEFLDAAFSFSSKEYARKTFFQAQDLFRNWNYTKWQSPEFEQGMQQLDALLAARGVTAEAA